MIERHSRILKSEIRNLAGFTVTDLLVIFAIVSLLAAIGFYWVTAARSKSRLARCTGNLQQISRAILAFAADNKQTLPAGEPGDAANPWWFYKEQVKRYAGLSGASSSADVLFACPDDRGYSDPRPFHDTPRFDFSSYVYNGIDLPGMPSILGWEIAAVKKPKNTLLVMEWTAHAPLSWHKSKTGKTNMPFYTDAQSVTAFVDGHVSFTKIYYDGYNAAYTQDPIANYEYQYSGN
jgi:type II secretory pathway pseudopilin PulG